MAEFVSAAEERRAGLEGRLVYAPKTEMTESGLTEAVSEMGALRERIAREGGGVAEEEAAAQADALAAAAAAAVAAEEAMAAAAAEKEEEEGANGG